MKNKFFTRYLSLWQIFYVCLFLATPFLVVLIKSRDTQILDLLFLTYISILFMFTMCSYMLLKTIVINSEGIEIWFFKRNISKYSWSKILSIEKSNYMRNPVLEITLHNEEIIYVEYRKQIVRAIEYYANGKIQIQ